MKVYAIMRGKYSDSYIYGIVSDKNVAKTVCQQLKDTYDGAYYNEYELDNIKLCPIDYKSFIVTYDWSNKLFDVEEKDDPSSWDDFYGDGTYYPTTRIYYEDKYYWIHNVEPVITKIEFFMVTKDEEHALKIAQDRLAELKAEMENIN